MRLDDDARWAAVIARDAAADGGFVYSVKTTGVYCRPSCPSRSARREHVAFHAGAAAARAAGFRPCLRCRPDEASAGQRKAAIVAAACRRLEGCGSVPTLDRLAAEAGFSPFHFQRLFKSVTGVTPRAYAAAHRRQRLESLLPGAASVTDAFYDAGFSSSGRFYEQSDAALGMTPTTRRAGGQRTRIHFAIAQCSLGAVLVAQSARGVCAILLGDDAEALLRDLQDRFPNAELVGGDAAFETRVAQVIGLVEAPRQGLDLPLDIRGTAFQQRVWETLRAIPPGSTASYTEIAARIGAPAAVRAVAGACAANPLAVAVPCHRVVRSDGALSGYRWGLERKRELLRREAAPDA